MSTNKNPRSRQRKKVGTVPLLNHDKREGSVLSWSLNNGVVITRDTKDTDVVMWRDGDVTASVTKDTAAAMGQKLYRDAGDDKDSDVAIYARALCSASIF